MKKGHSGTIIYMRTVPGNPKLHALTQELSCKMWDGTTHIIPQGFSWNGASSCEYSIRYSQDGTILLHLVGMTIDAAKQRTKQIENGQIKNLKRMFVGQAGG